MSDPPCGDRGPALNERCAKVRVLLAREYHVRRQDEARQVWKLLGAARPFLDDAIEGIRSTEKQTAELTAEPSVGFSNLYTTAEWKDLCAFVPSQLSE